jgi:integrase
MTVTPRGKSWQATVNHKGQRLRKDFPTEREAQVWELETKAALLAGKPVGKAEAVNAVPTLASLLETVVEPYWRTRKAGKGLIENGQHVVALLGGTRLCSSLTVHDADRVRAHYRGKGRSEATVNRKLAALSVIVKFAHERGYLDRKFSVGITKERNSGRKRTISLEEEARMVAYCQSMGEGDLLDYIVVSLDTGFRQGEVLKIRAQDAGRAFLRTYDTKNGRSRSVPLSERAKATLERRVKGLAPDARVFPQQAQWLLDHWHAMRTWMGIGRDEDFVPHAMRHTFVTRLLEAGVDIKTVQELAGHESITTTQGYAHSSEERKMLAIQRLSGYMPHGSHVAPHGATA